MLMVYKVREAMRATIPAVTHVDDTGRLQTVNARSNPRYHALISEFFRQTGVPLVLNTSFNEHEPIVATPADAIACYLKTRMDVLALGNWVLTRRPACSVAQRRVRRELTSSKGTPAGKTTRIANKLALPDVFLPLTPLT